MSELFIPICSIVRAPHACERGTGQGCTMFCISIDIECRKVKRSGILHQYKNQRNIFRRVLNIILMSKAKFLSWTYDFAMVIF
jgi:hypothetical protein